MFACYLLRRCQAIIIVFRMFFDVCCSGNSLSENLPTLPGFTTDFIDPALGYVLLTGEGNKSRVAVSHNNT